MQKSYFKALNAMRHIRDLESQISRIGDQPGKKVKPAQGKNSENRQYLREPRITHQNRKR